jgi:hypothetical protein
VLLDEEGLYRVAPQELPLLRYYANAIAEVVAKVEGRLLQEAQVPHRFGQLALEQEATPVAGT